VVELPQALRSSAAKDELILVVGSGASIAATGAPGSAASWSGLLAHGVGYALSQGLITDRGAQAASTLLEQGQLGAVASLIRDALQDHRADWLGDAFGSLEFADGPHRLHDAIRDLGTSVIVTTNYDDLLERWLDRGPVAWTGAEFGNALRSGRHARREILHVHGYYEEDGSVILDPSDYARLEASAAMDAFAVAAAHRSLLFVGCGPDGLRDRHFRQLWTWLERLGNSAPHYVLLPGSADTTAIRAAGFSRLTFLRFDDSADDPYAELVGVLQQLADEAAATNTQVRDMGRAVVHATRSVSVTQRIVVIRAEVAPAPEHATGPDVRQNLLDRLQRLLNRETRGADLCVLYAPVDAADLQGICRNSDVPVLARAADGTVSLVVAEGGAVRTGIALPARITVRGGMPEVGAVDGDGGGFVLADDLSTIVAESATLVVSDDVTGLAGPAPMRPQETAHVQKHDSRWQILAPDTGDVVLSFEVDSGAKPGAPVAHVDISEVVYGLAQSSFARLSRAIEGSDPLTPELARELRSTLEGLTPKAFPLLRADLDAAEREPAGSTALCHRAAPAHLRSAREALYESLVDDTSAQRLRLELLPWVRRSLRHAGDASAALATERQVPRQLIVAASLGKSDPERAARAFPLQRTLLAYVAQQRLRLTYTLTSRQPAAQGHAGSERRFEFHVHCFAGGDREPASVAESQSVAALVQSAFHNNYSIQYSTAVAEDLHDASVASGDATDYARAWIVPKSDGAWPVSDYGLIADYIRTLPADVAVTWECSGDLGQVNDAALHSNQVIGPSPHPSLGASAFDELRRLAVDPAFSTRRVALRCLVSVRGHDENAASLAREVGTLVGTEVFGADHFEIETDDPGSYTPVSIGGALLVMHTPFGQMYTTSYDTDRRFVLALRDQRFDEGVALGTATRKQVDRDQNELVRLSDVDRFHHVHVVGRPGTGKTTLLKRMILGDLMAGHGATIVDPHGSLADWTIENLPANRVDDTVFIDLDNRSFAPVLNLLDVEAAHGDDYERVVSEIIHFIRSRNYHEWSGPAFEQLVRLALLSMKDPAYPAPPSLTELPLLLGNDRMRAAMGQRASSEELRDNWRLQGQQGHQHGAELLQWVIAKFDELTKDPVLRAFLGGEHSTLDVRSAIADGKILIFRLASTRVSEQASDFIGSMFLTMFQQGLLDIASSRDRPPHFVYIDEFHRFATLGLERLVVEARKFKVGMTLAHQNLSQLSAFQQHTGRFLEGVPSTLVGNAGTLVVFPVSSYDRHQLARELGCSADDIGRLARFQALVRASATAGAIEPFTIEIDDMGEPDATKRSAHLARKMRERRLWLPIAEVLDGVAERQHGLREWSKDDGSWPTGVKVAGAGTPPPDQGTYPGEVDFDDLPPFLREWFELRDAEAARLGSTALEESALDDDDAVSAAGPDGRDGHPAPPEPGGPPGDRGGGKRLFRRGPRQ
jgi:hypothetical protein